MVQRGAGLSGLTRLGLGVAIAAGLAAAYLVGRRLTARTRAKPPALLKPPEPAGAPAPALRLARIVIPVANPATAASLVRLGSALGAGRPPAELAALKVVAAPKGMPLDEARRFVLSMRESYEGALAQARGCAGELGIALHTELEVARQVAPAILAFARRQPEPDLLLLGWRGAVSLRRVRRSINQEIVRQAATHVAVLRDRGLESIRHILVPVGWGPHARFGLRLAEALAINTQAQVTAFRVLPMIGDVDWEGEREALVQLLAAEAPSLRFGTELRLAREPGIALAILTEARRVPYDLVVIGASDEWWLRNWLFGAIPDQVAERAPCSVLLVRRRLGQPGP